MSVVTNEARAGDLYFWCRYSNETREDISGKGYIYLVTADEDLFDYYI